MLKVGLVGIGGISNSHIPAWDHMENTNLTAICDVRRECMAPYPDKRQYVDFDEMLRQEELDILDICLPTCLHVDFAVKAMERGIHVLCEKPISLKEEDIGRAYDAARKNNVNFMVAQVLRFWPEYELLKSIFDSGRYGRLLSGYMSRLGGIPRWSWDNWMKDEKRSGLVPFDLHIHDLDFMVYAFGRPQNIQKHRSQLPNQDYISAVYEYPGFFITTECSWYAAPYPFTAGFRFQFEEALVVYDGKKCVIYQNDGQIFDLTDGDAGPVTLPKSNAYAEEIRYFTDCVEKGCFPDKVKPEELHTVLEILKTL